MQSRIKNTKKNIIVSYIYAGINFLFQFISRSLIIKYLGEEYLGLSSLFTSILHVLNMAELGFSGAIVYNMYKPLAEKNTAVVCSLLNYYKKIYRIVGLTVLIAGTIVSPFIPKLIKGSYPKETNIYILYFLYLINTAISYFLFAYKNSLLEASQRMDLSKLAYSFVSIGQYFLQVIVLVFFKNYYLFLIVLILGTALKNVTVAIIANRYFPEYNCKGNISAETKSEVINRVKGLLVCNISGITYTTFDSIILSACVGLTSVAIYNNYITVYTGVTTIVSYLRHAMQASVGNSVATENRDKNYNDMLLWQYFFSGIALWCVTCLLNLYQPFMKLWMGEKLLLPMRDVVILCAWFAVTVVQHAYFLYLSGNGLWWELKWPYICSTVFNLVGNIILGKRLGITGILIASFLSSFVFCFIWQSSIIFKIYFRRSVIGYMTRQILYFFVMFISCILSWFVCKLVPVEGVAGLIVKAAICTIISMIVILTSSFKTEVYKRAKQFLIRALKA